MKTMRYVSSLVVLGLIGCGAAPDQSGEDAESVSTTQQALTCSDNQVPAMTSLTAPSGTITRSGAYGSSYEAFNAFDGKSSLWLSALNQTPAWLDYKWSDGPRMITSYAIKFANGSLTSRAPKDWTLQGFNGTSWVAVDTRTNQTSWLSTETRTYTVANPGSYSAYRLNVTDDNDARAGIVVVSIDELQLMGCTPHTVDWYMQQAGLPTSAQIGEEKDVEACDMQVEQGAVSLNSGVTQTCMYQPPTGWQIESSWVEVLRNDNSRGSYSSNVIAAGGQFTMSEEEFGNKWKAAFDLAASYDDVDVEGKLELEFERHRSLFYSVESNYNTFWIQATANGGLFAKSVIHVKGHVKLVRVT